MPSQDEHFHALTR